MLLGIALHLLQSKRCIREAKVAVGLVAMQVGGNLCRMFHIFQHLGIIVLVGGKGIRLRKSGLLQGIFGVAELLFLRSCATQGIGNLTDEDGHGGAIEHQMMEIGQQKGGRRGVYHRQTA